MGDRIGAVSLPDGEVLQLFYRGADSAIWTRWRNPDGTWSAEERLGGTAVGDPTAVAVPGTKLLQLFYRGADGAIWTRWRNPDGTWSDEERLRASAGRERRRHSVVGDPIAAVLPGTDRVFSPLFFVSVIPQVPGARPSRFPAPEPASRDKSISPGSSARLVER